MSGVPEALFAGYDREEEGETVVNREALDEAMEWPDCLVLGPGLGTGEMSADIVSYVLEHCLKPIVLDGDGITLCSKELLRKKEDIILTPHPKEFSRITGREVSELKKDFLNEVASFARETGCIVAGKDARTVVSNGQEVYVNVSGNSGMGTGGSGDVLTGIIAGMLVQGLDCFAAARVGVYLHGLAGDCFSERLNEYSLTATGLLEGLKEALSQIEG